MRKEEPSSGSLTKWWQLEGKQGKVLFWECQATFSGRGDKMAKFVHSSVPGTKMEAMVVDGKKSGIF